MPKSNRILPTWIEILAKTPALTLALALLLCGGCMITPSNNGVVFDTDAPLNFSGYHTQPSASVQLKAWSFTANRMVNLGGPVSTSSRPAPAYFSDPIFPWSASRPLADEFWRAGPNGGQCAVTAADTPLGAGNFSLMTLDPGWVSCYQNNPTISGFYSNCRSVNHPVAAVFSNDWRPVDISRGVLGLAGTLASSRVSVVLDNFTPTAFQFCNASSPGGCPTPTSDPNTYKFFRPNGGSVAADGTTINFSITPSRKNPMTVYIDDMSSRRLDFAAEGSNVLVMGINFESSGPEIRMNCINNFFCAFVDGRTLELGSPRAVVRFPLMVRRGELTYDTATVTFTATGNSDVQAAARNIGQGIAERVNGSPAVKSAISATLDGLLHEASGLDAAYPIAEVSVLDGGFRLRAGCPRD